MVISIDEKNSVESAYIHDKTSFNNEQTRNQRLN